MMKIEMPANAEVLEMSQTAPQYLQKQSTALQNASFFPGLVHGESLDNWSRHEQILLSCLRTGDDKSALISLERLINRFGAENERVAALRGLYQEAVADNDAALRDVLQEYESILSTVPTNLVFMNAHCKTFEVTDYMTADPEKTHHSAQKTYEAFRSDSCTR